MIRSIKLFRGYLEYDAKCSIFRGYVLIFYITLPLITIASLIFARGITELPIRCLSASSTKQTRKTTLQSYNKAHQTAKKPIFTLTAFQIILGYDRAVNFPRSSSAFFEFVLSASYYFRNHFNPQFIKPSALNIVHSLSFNSLSVYYQKFYQM